MITATSMLAKTIIYSGTAPARIREQAANFVLCAKKTADKAVESYKYYYSTI